MSPFTPDPTGSDGQRVHYSDATLTLLVGDAVEQLRTLPDGSVNCIVTSPPYYRQRNYDGHLSQIGQERTPAEYVARLVDVFHEARRVLAVDGTLWLNLGDTYNSHAKGRVGLPDPSLPPKNLLLMPERVALALQQDGWMLRNRVVWHKINGKPDPHRDRLAPRHESLFLFTRTGRYHFDLTTIRVPHAAKSKYQQDVARRQPHTAGKSGAVQNQGGHAAGLRELHPDGANPGDVWSIATTPLRAAHFAPMPAEMARRCIAAGCKPDGVVMDLFSGAGTTAVVARQLGRPAIGIDLNPEYHDIALRRMSTATIPFGEPA